MEVWINYSTSIIVARPLSPILTGTQYSISPLFQTSPELCFIYFQSNIRKIRLQVLFLNIVLRVIFHYEHFGKIRGNPVPSKKLIAFIIRLP